MNKVFYPKLAWNNLLRNRATYFPYGLAAICTMAMFYILHAISMNIGINGTIGTEYIKVILFLGTIVVGIFSVIFLFYTNSFLMKRRKKEIGLLNILGMEKKHIAKMLLYEMSIIAGICMILGVATGILMSRLIFMFLLKLLNFKTAFIFSVAPKSIELTLGLFGILFLLTLLTNFIHIKLAKPIELLKGGQTGEKEPKSKKMTTIFGVMTLGIGYGIAIFVKSPLAAIFLFFVAAILVMAGTYALFTSGSIVLLKALRKNKKFYYQTNHFTSVSNMIYRMKQNAVGLANICILSSAVLVMLSTTVALYIGIEDGLKNRFPMDIMVNAKDITTDQRAIIDMKIKDLTNEIGADAQELQAFPSKSYLAIREGKLFAAKEESISYRAGQYLMTLITVSDFNKMEGTELLLEPDEVGIYSNNHPFDGQEIILGSMPFRVKEEYDRIKSETKTQVVVFNAYYVIVKDEATIMAIYKDAFGKEMGNLNYFVGFNIEASNEKLSIFVSEFIKAMKANGITNTFIESKQLNRESFLEMVGGLLFLGIFLGTLFLMATALIIYYKQISEGYDDQERYEIMQKVGLSHEEVRSTIRSQVLMVFFLPLLAAIVHIMVAFKMITRLLAVLNLTNIPLFFWCTLGTILVFAAIYAAVYLFTAKSYYKIVLRY